MFEEIKTKIDAIRSDIDEMILDEEFREDLQRFYTKGYPDTGNPLHDVEAWHTGYVTGSFDEIIEGLDNIQEIFDKSQIAPEPEEEEEEEEEEEAS